MTGNWVLNFDDNDGEEIDDTVTYGVKKGIKYALYMDSGHYAIKSKFQAVTENGGKKKAAPSP